MANKIICIVGMTGSGKTVVSNIFVEKGYQYLRFGQITLDEVKRRIGLKSDPELERKIREDFRKKYGPAAFAILNKEKIDKLIKKGNVVIDNLSSWSEYKYLKNKYGNGLKVIAVQCSPDIRYKRLIARKKIDKKMINRPFSIKDAKKRDYDEIEKIEKGGPIVMADFTILNIGTVNDLKAKTNEAILKTLKISK